MKSFQHDHNHEYIAALLDLMLATNEATDPRALANQALDWLMARDGVTSGGVWLAQSSDLVCLARRNLDLDDVVPAIQQAIEAAAPAPLTSVYQQDLRLTILPLAITNDHRGALVVVTQAPPDPGELLLLRAVAAHLAATITRPPLWPSRRAGASDRDWEEFLAHAAHEIKNPLASIKGYADLLLRRAAKAKDPADPYRKGLTTISHQVGRTTTLLDQLSDITRLGAGSLLIDRHEADLAMIIDQVVQEYQAADQQHTIAFDRGDRALPGRFDPVRIAQVISAIISNALKFSFDGGVVSVQLQRLNADDGTALARLAVSDTGVGVPDGEQERIFERFFRGSNVRGTYAGLGVELYLARAIVDQHGGRIWLESQQGLRTTCHVALPLAA
jgi:signal transduction histidine kinase